MTETTTVKEEVVLQPSCGVVDVHEKGGDGVQNSPS